MLLAIFLVMLGVTLVEIWTFAQLGALVGWPAVLAACVVTALLGSAACRWQGLKAIAAIRESVRRLAQLDFEVLCFSHFPPIKKGASRILRQFADSLD